MKLNGTAAFGKLLEIKSYENVDERTKAVRRSISLVAAVRFDAHTSLPVPIYLQDGQTPPNLKVGERYGYPVLIKPKTGGKGLAGSSYTLRTDLPPFPAPEIDGTAAFGEFVEMKSYENVDERTKAVRRSISLVVALRFDQHTSSLVSIYLQDGQTPPNLRAGEHYGYPVLIKPKTGGKGLLGSSYTLRTDLPPFPAPEIG
jgi:hypothetical protein